MENIIPETPSEIIVDFLTAKISTLEEEVNNLGNFYKKITPYLSSDQALRLREVQKKRTEHLGPQILEYRRRNGLGKSD